GDRELEERPARVQERDEARERLGLHEDVRRDAAAPVHHATRVRVEDFLLLRGRRVVRRAGLLGLALLLLGGEVLQNVLVVALDAAARGRVVLGGREGQARAVRQRVDRLHEALAPARL